MPRRRKDRPDELTVTIDPREYEIPDELRPGIYSNIQAISSTPFEITIDFGYFELRKYEGRPAQLNRRLVARLHMNPVVAKAFARLIGESITRHEANFGPIQPIQNVTVESV